MSKDTIDVSKVNMDMGDMKSRDIGNLLSKGLVNLGKEQVQSADPTDAVDYGDLPSKTLPELGKQALKSGLE